MTDETYDVVIIGAGVAGAAAAYELRDLNVAVVERESFLGGRTYSEQFGEVLWANYGAGYFSSDKGTILSLGDKVDVPFIPFDDTALAGDFVPEGYDKQDIAEIRQVKRRLAKEQSNLRDPASPELDQVTFEAWLGPVRPNVRQYFQYWCSIMSCPMEELSLYGTLLMSGSNRTTAFSDEPVTYDPRGNLVVKGGNGLIAQHLLQASKADVFTNTQVQSVTGTPIDGYLIEAEAETGPVALRAQRVIVTTPTPIVLDILKDLPDWKTAALSSIEYGRIIGMPVVVGSATFNGTPFRPTADYRPDAVYCETEFMLRSPTDLDKDGAYFVSQVHDQSSRVLWDDDDATLRAGVHAAFTAKFPELSDRIMHIGVHRWPYAVAKYTRGRMAATPDLCRPVGGISFAGDYTDVTHTDGAAKSGLRAANEVRAALKEASMI
ncbi:MAG: FAD-dependent oxidoreductase [Hyphomonadaceae bacterium]|nr:FAD-dependent oxidoreductase [Hyphomonadaceae bacterium]